MWEGEGVRVGMEEERDAGVEERPGRERHQGWIGNQLDRRRVTRA